MAYNRYGVQQRPDKKLNSENEKALKPAVTHIAEPEQAQDIGDRAAY